MQKTTVKVNNYNIHFIKTNKFKTINIRVMFYDELKKVDITKRNFLLDMLVHSTKQYPTKRELNIRCQELYSLSLSSSNFRIGNYLIAKVETSFLNPEYTDNTMLEESINLLYDVIFNPNITNNAFDNEAFKQIKDNLKSEIETVKEQPRIYAGSRLLEIMDDGPYAYHSYCYMDDLKDLTPTNLYSFYKEFLLNNKVEIFVVGDIDIKKITKLIANRFFFNNQNNVNKSLFYKHHSFKEKVYETTEKGNYNQAKVAASVKLKDLTEFETKYVSVIYNLLLGGTTESLLVKNIRENSSLAYYAYSLLNKADNLIVINCGIDEKNYQQVYNLINKSLNDVLEGNFSLEDINKCIMEYISSLKIAYETPAGVLDLMLAEILYNVDDIKTKMAKIKTVTKEDVMNFSKKTTLDTVFMLKGE